MEKDPRRWLAALRTSHQTVVAQVKSLSPEQLTQPSYCADWDVSQVISHLGSGAEISLLGLESTVDGLAPLERDAMMAIWSRWDNSAPEERAREMVRWDRRAVSVFEGLDDQTISSLHAQFHGMDLAAVDLVAMRLGEHAVHTWDIAVTFDPGAELLPSSAELLVDRLAFMASRTGKADGVEGDLRIGVHTSAPERHFVLTVNDKVSLEPVEDGNDGDLKGALSLPAAALIRLVYGRLDDQHTPESVSEEGDVHLADLRRAFPGF